MDEQTPAFEYITILSFAFLILALVIATLHFFNPFDSLNIIPSKAFLSAGLAVRDYEVTPNSVNLVIQNSKEDELTINSIKISSQNCLTEPNVPLKRGEEHDFRIDCPIQGSV